ncbi:MAG: HAMP domain-containing histidine kinase, partial [Candidatus Pacebacteria bacterium]|nr:HAMP domain-containing histidine kinase [Candidatus Paceibacterota bacterium]
MVESTISVQTLGIGVAAFVATLAAAFLYINASKERSARAFADAMVGAAVWGWFGFSSAIAAEHANMELAREMRILSFVGNVLLTALFVRFAVIYRTELVPLQRVERLTHQIVSLCAAAFVTLLMMDLFVGTTTVVGVFYQGAVTPIRGPFFDIFVLYYCVAIVVIYLLMRVRVAQETGPSHRGHVILLAAMTFGSSAGIAGYAAWYELYSPILTGIRALAVPSLSFSAFYAMSTHKIFNVRVAAANAFVFAIWTFLFFRILLNGSLADSIADIMLLAALILLGILLIRSFNLELEGRLRVERAEKERAIEQSKAEFISIAAHQLRTPLAGIRWSFSVLESAKSGMTKEQQDLIRQASARTKDVVERVNEMLRAARLSAGEGFTFALSPADIRPIVKESVDLFEGAAATRNLKLTVTLPRKVLTARIDRDKFAMAIQNLVDNAIKYTKTGAVAVSAIQENDRIFIRVADTGIGITSDDR